jgi:hypothetical protein
VAIGAYSIGAYMLYWWLYILSVAILFVAIDCSSIGGY